MLLSRHQFLFTQCSLADRLKQPFNDANCWLRFVAEAIETKDHHVAILMSEAAEFFPKNRPNVPFSPSETISLASTVLYSPSLDDSRSIETVRHFQSPSSTPIRDPST
jgi:hypothetical protein